MMFAALLILAGAFLSIESWRGKRAWLACKRDAAARGEHLDFELFIPPSVPDKQHFAMPPLLAPLLDYRLDTPPRVGSWYRKPVYREEKPPVKRLSIFVESSATSLMQNATWLTGNFTDLAVWQKYSRDSGAVSAGYFARTVAEDVLIFLKKYDAALDELQAASRQPFARFPVHYNVGFKRIAATFDDTNDSDSRARFARISRA